MYEWLLFGDAHYSSESYWNALPGSEVESWFSVTWHYYFRGAAATKRCTANLNKGNRCPINFSCMFFVLLLFVSSFLFLFFSFGLFNLFTFEASTYRKTAFPHLAFSSFHGIVLVSLLPYCDPQYQRRTLNSSAREEGTAVLMSYLLSVYCCFANARLPAGGDSEWFSNTAQKTGLERIAFICLLAPTH